MTRRHRAPGSQGGFTLLELLIVVAIIALASSVVALALPDPGATRLEREAQRLATLLEGGRAQARALGLPVYWTLGAAPPRPGTDASRPADEPAPPQDFHFDGLPAGNDLPTRWLDAGSAADPASTLQVELLPPRRAVQLGPEPVIPAQRIVLRLGDRRATIATDGLGPFSIQSDGDAPAPAH
ncbi:MAG TPA: prepilin-type N-terminal cleavage/methylation domain-containing protein [Burkholderiaceae bacterium]|nr:prepilin-type N-terminal cleavage/methylation domain-containing protein [Burkholderiaceae bacterium]HNB44774.1 prepilin-type N-terminal cleavage/methylation domain-containing protein [Burkholderiaceae bacterium]HNG82002.1 prepilin-type N-terminal cleavage/methylation domain-containing protein [Burkholderiaceae bacterium]